MRTEELGRLLLQTNIKGEVGLPLLGVSVATGVRPRFDSDGRPAPSLDLSNYKTLEPGNIVMNALGKPHGSIGRSDVRGITSPAYWVLETTDELDSRFAHHLLRSHWMVQRLAGLGKNQPPNQFDISWDVFRRIRVDVPALAWQRRIADFLDDRVSRIDQIIAARHSQMVLIVKRVEGLIARELSPLSPLDAHQEALPLRVPRSWSMPRLSYVVNIGSGSSITSENIEPRGDFPVYGANGVRGFTSSFTHADNRVLIGRQGALCGNVILASGPFWASEHALVCEPQAPFDMSWIVEVLRSMNLGQYSQSAAQPGISASVVGSMRVPWVGIDHQQRLGELCSAWREEGVNACKQVVQSIDLLTEYKTSLITAAVTGELDVTTAGSKLLG